MDRHQETILLFDIDGTLLLSGGAGRVAMQRVMSEMFAAPSLPSLKVHGRTDHGIISELFEALQIELTDERRQQFTEAYHGELEICLPLCTGRLMPAIEPLLNWLDQQANVRLGILTGNSRSAAKAKLQHFGLEQFFDFRLAGFGERFGDRNDVAQVAWEQCRSVMGNALRAEQIWVIGDTIRDVACARSIGAKVTAVATGGDTLETLEESQPDLLVSDLSDREHLAKHWFASTTPA